MQAAGSGAGWEGARREHWHEQNPVRWGGLCTPAHRRQHGAVRLCSVRRKESGRCEAGVGGQPWHL